MATRTQPTTRRPADLFHALSDGTRLSILQRLRFGERCVCDLTDALDAAQSRLSFHLKVLKDAGLVTDRKDGRWMYYTLNTEALAEVERAARRARGRAAPPRSAGPAAADATFFWVTYQHFLMRITMSTDDSRPPCGSATGRPRCGSPTRSEILVLRRLVRHRAPTIRSPRTSTAQAETALLPAEAVLASLGCGNPTALAELHEGEVVLDLGSGGGIDVLLSARRVGPDRQGVRPRHDRRDAGAGAREPAQGRRRRTPSSSGARSRPFPCPTRRWT